LAYQSIARDHWHNTGYVFTQSNGNPIDPDLITKAFQNMVEEIGVPHLTPHGLRHQYATTAREMGLDMDVISKNLGHASVVITNDIYAHLTPEVMEDGAQKIVSKLFGE
jgi:integrase